MIESNSLSVDKSAEGNDPSIEFSIPLYVLMESKPRPDNPDWIDLVCYKSGSAELVIAYISKLDAMIDCCIYNRNGHRYKIVPIEAVNFQYFIDTHDGWLNISLVHSFAASDSCVLLSQKRELIAMIRNLYYQVPNDVYHQGAYIELDNALLDWLQHFYESTGLHDYAELLNSFAEASDEELFLHARVAISKMKSKIKKQSNNLSEYCVYDAIEQRWRYVGSDNYSTS